MIALLAALLLTAEPAPRAEYRLVPFNLSIEPTLLNLNGRGPTADTVSLNLPLGGSARLRGLSLSALGSLIDEDAVGVQIAGLFNREGGGVRGVDVAGAANWSRGPVEGAQLAGVFNRSQGASTGLQLAGGFNVADQLRGLQFSLVNVDGDAHGAQLGLLNIATGVHGAQIGLVNVAGNVDGAQVGVVNVASEVAAPMGILDFVHDEQVHFEAWTGDSAPFNVGVTLGTRRVFTLLTVGCDPFAPASALLAGLSFGLHFPLIPSDRLWIDADAGTLNLFQGSNLGALTFDSQELFGKLRGALGYSFTRHLAAFAGLTLNGLLQRPANQAPDIGYGLELDTGSRLTHIHFWLGPFVGVKL